MAVLVAAVAGVRGRIGPKSGLRREQNGMGRRSTRSRPTRAGQSGTGGRRWRWRRPGTGQPTVAAAVATAKPFARSRAGDAAQSAAPVASGVPEQAAAADHTERPWARRRGEYHFFSLGLSVRVLFRRRLVLPGYLAQCGPLVCSWIMFYDVWRYCWVSTIHSRQDALALFQRKSHFTVSTKRLLTNNQFMIRIRRFNFITELSNRFYFYLSIYTQFNPFLFIEHKLILVI